MSKSSANWLQRQRSDKFVRLAKQDGYRSRAAYKLLELQKKYNIIRPGMKVVDLGAAPGGFSVVAAKLVGQHGSVVACDLLDLQLITGVHFIKGDFTDPNTLKLIKAQLKGQADVILSDMAPNISGIQSVDQHLSIKLVELAYDFATTTLKTGGSLIVKLFQGSGVSEYVASLKKDFKLVKIAKPNASRVASREVYLVAKELL